MRKGGQGRAADFRPQTSVSTVFLGNLKKKKGSKPGEGGREKYRGGVVTFTGGGRKRRDDGS